MQNFSPSNDIDHTSLRHASDAGEPVRLLRVAAWQKLPWLMHGFSTRTGGVSRAYAAPDAPSEMNLGFTAEDSAENVRENRRRLVEAVSGSAATPLRTVRQIHSCHSEVVPLFAAEGYGADTAAWDPPQADGILTRQAGILLGILTADCVPVLVADPRNRVVAAFHAGWRGTVQRVVELGIAHMAAEFGSDPDTLLAAIGPAIGPCCYTVGDEVRGRFAAEFPYADALFAEEISASASAELRLDLAEANRRQLIAAGLENARISRAGACTSCHPGDYYSHRASSGHAGRMMSAIGVRKENHPAN